MKKDKKKTSRQEEKNLSGSDIILNLKEISVGAMDSFSSSSCSGHAGFCIDCSTQHGYCEDPNFLGKIRVLDIKKGKQQNVYSLKIKFEREEKENG